MLHRPATDLGPETPVVADGGLSQPPGACGICPARAVPDHVHLLVYLKPNLPEPLKTLGRFMAGFKRVAAKNAGVTWQQGYHDRICLSRFIKEKVAAYIAGNPLKWLLMHGPDAPLKVHEPLDSPRFPETEWWTAAGNLALLSPERRIAAVSVSRSLRPGDIPAVVARLLKAAREGWVVASTFISPGEIAVRQALEAEKLPCIKAVPHFPLLSKYYLDG